MNCDNTATKRPARMAMIESSSALPTTFAALRGLPSIRIARKGVTALGIKLVGAALALALQVCLARSLGHAGYGEYAYVIAWLQLMLIFAHGGFATAALRYVAEYRARCQPALARGFVKFSSQIALLESIVLALLMAGCAAALHRSGSTGPLRNLLIASAVLPVLSQLTLGAAIVRGLGHVIPSMLVGLAQPLLLLGALLSSVHLFRIHISSSEALLLYLCATVGALGMVVVLQGRFERDLGEASEQTFYTREWLCTATQMMFASGLIYIQGRTGVIISGLLLDAGEAGTYAAMERLADVALLGLTSVNLLVAPKFAALHAQQRLVELQRYARLAAWGACAFMLAAVLPLVLFGKPILRCFGDEFVSGYPVLLVLLGGVVVNAMCGSVGLILSMTGHQRDTIIVAFSGLCLNLTLSLLLIPKYGIMGTAVANAVAIAAWNVSMLLIVRWRLGIWTCIGVSNRPIREPWNR